MQNYRIHHNEGQLYTYRHIHMHRYMCTHLHIYMYIPMLIHMYTHVHMHTDTQSAHPSIYTHTLVYNMYVPVFISKVLPGVYHTCCIIYVKFMSWYKVSVSHKNLLLIWIKCTALFTKQYGWKCKHSQQVENNKIFLSLKKKSYQEIEAI